MMSVASASWSSPPPGESRKRKFVDETLNGAKNGLDIIDQMTESTSPIKDVASIVQKLISLIEEMPLPDEDTEAFLDEIKEITDRLVHDGIEEVDPEDAAEDGPFSFIRRSRRGTVGELKKDLESIYQGLERYSGRKRMTMSPPTCLSGDDLKDLITRLKNAKEKFVSIDISLQMPNIGQTWGDTGARASPWEEGDAGDAEKISNTDDMQSLERLPRADASHRSDIRSSDFLQGTREAELRELYGWASDPTTEFYGRLGVLIGSSGTGKSTMTCELAKCLQKPSHLFGSFMFSQYNAGDRSSTRLLVPTIAYQLASLFPEFQLDIAQGATEYLASEPMTVEEQLETLILEPVRNLCQNHPPMVLVLDGIDEISTDDIQKLFVLVHKLLEALPPVRVLVTTRPTRIVEEAIRNANLDGIARRFDLDHQVDPEVLKRDIHRFFNSRLAKLHNGSVSRGITNVVDILAGNSKLSFAHARITTGYLDHKVIEESSARLRSIVAGEAKAANNSTSDLDSLYAFILESIFKKEAMKDPRVSSAVSAVLANVVVLQDRVTVDVTARLFNLPVDHIISALGELHSVVSYDSEEMLEGRIQAQHSTFVEFIQDRTRCTNEDFYVDPHDCHTKMALSCLNILQTNLSRNICHLPRRLSHKSDIADLADRIDEHIAGHVLYACKYWATHVANATSSKELLQALRQFTDSKLLEWIETMSVLSQLDVSVQGLEQVVSWFSGSGLPTHNRTPVMLSDARCMILNFYEAINACAEQVYQTALTFAPDCLLVKHYASGDHADLHCNAKLCSPRPLAWNNSECFEDTKMAMDLDGVSSQEDKQRLHLVAFSPRGDFVATVAEDSKEVVIREASSGTTIDILTDGHEFPKSLAFSPDGSTLALGGYGGITVWDMRTTIWKNRFQMSDHDVYAIAYSPDGRYLAKLIGTVGNMSGVLSMLDINPGHALIIFDLREDSAKHCILTGIHGFQAHIHFSPSTINPIVSIVSFEGNGGAETHSWNYESGERVSNSQSRYRPPAIKVEEEWLVLESTSEKLCWLPESRRPAGGARYQRVDVHGRRVAICGKSGELTVVDVPVFENVYDEYDTDLDLD